MVDIFLFLQDFKSITLLSFHLHFSNKLSAVNLVISLYKRCLFSLLLTLFIFITGLKQINQDVPWYSSVHVSYTKVLLNNLNMKFYSSHQMWKNLAHDFSHIYLVTHHPFSLLGVQTAITSAFLQLSQSSLVFLPLFVFSTLYCFSFNSLLFFLLQIH